MMTGSQFVAGVPSALAPVEAGVLVGTTSGHLVRIDETGALWEVDLGSAVQELELLLRAIPTPAGVSVEITGQNEELQNSLESLQFALLMAVFLVYLVMASQFESLLHPFVILFTIPLALVGAVSA